MFPKKTGNYDYPDSAPARSSPTSSQNQRQGGQLLEIRAPAPARPVYRIPHKNQSVFVNNFTSSNVGLIYSYGFDSNNPNLGPERQKTYNWVPNCGLLNSKLSFDITAYYNTLCTDQIQNQFRQLRHRFILNTQNAASSRNQGVEVVADIPVQKSDWSWNVRFNFTLMWSKVLTLPEAIAYRILYR